MASSQAHSGVLAGSLVSDISVRIRGAGIEWCIGLVMYLEGWEYPMGHGVCGGHRYHPCLTNLVLQYFDKILISLPY